MAYAIYIESDVEDNRSYDCLGVYRTKADIIKHYKNTRGAKAADIEVTKVKNGYRIKLWGYARYIAVKI